MSSSSSEFEVISLKSLDSLRSLHPNSRESPETVATVELVHAVSLSSVTSQDSLRDSYEQQQSDLSLCEESSANGIPHSKVDEQLEAKEDEYQAKIQEQKVQFKECMSTLRRLEAQNAELNGVVAALKLELVKRNADLEALMRLVETLETKTDLFQRSTVGIKVLNETIGTPVYDEALQYDINGKKPSNEAKEASADNANEQEMEAALKVLANGKKMDVEELKEIIDAMETADFKKFKEIQHKIKLQRAKKNRADTQEQESPKTNSAEDAEESINDYLLGFTLGFLTCTSFVIMNALGILLVQSWYSKMQVPVSVQVVGDRGMLRMLRAFGLW